MCIDAEMHRTGRKCDLSIVKLYRNLVKVCTQSININKKVTFLFSYIAPFILNLKSEVTWNTGQRRLIHYK